MLAEMLLSTTAPAVQLRIEDRRANPYRFISSLDGRTWTNLLPGRESVAS